MKLRLAILATLVLLLSVSNAFALMYGSPVSSLKAGHVSLGFGYGAQNFAIKGSNAELHQQVPYVQIGFGFGGGWELYGRGGGADLDLEDAGPSGEPMRETLMPFAGGGINGRLYDGQVLDIALFAQGNFYTIDDYEDEILGTSFVLTDYWDASGGIAFEVEIDKSYLYAGPFYYTYEATVEVGGLEGDIEPPSQVGGMFGIRWPLVSGWELDVEGQIRKNYVFGAQLNYPF